MYRVVMLDKQSLSSETILAPLSSPNQWEEHPATSPEQVVDRIKDADIIALSKVVIDQQIIEQCPKLKHIAVAATGYNVIDIDACRQHAVSVSNIPSYAANSVAEHVISVTLALRRELIQYRQQVLAGAWHKSPGFCLFDKPLNDIRGATIGIVGMGDIGQQTAKLAAAMGMRVIFSARRVMQFDNATQVSFEQLLASSDVISLHCSLNSSTSNLIGASELAKMQDHAILVNTARGGIVNESALVSAIQNEVIAGAAFDVLVEEPPKSNSPLLTIAERSNVIITPHMSWTSQQAMQVLANTLMANINQFIDGKPQNLI